MTNDIQIFITYSWQDKAVVDEIDNHFLTLGINLIRDVREISYKESIYTFMKRIRSSDFVIMVLSDAYLKSLNCMNEVIELIKDDDFKDRILHILPYSDSRKADIFTPLGKIKYVEFWQQKFIEFKSKLDTIDDINKGLIIYDLKKYQTISSSISDFLSIVSDMLAIQYNDLKNANYKQLIDKIGLKDSSVILELLKIEKIETFDEKLNAIDLVIFKNHNNALGYLYKGMFLFNNQSFKQAIFNLERSIDINPSNPIPYTYIGGAYDEIENYNEALKYYEKSLAIDSKWSKTLVWQGITLDNLKKYEEALKSYSEALKINPLAIENFELEKELTIYKDLEIENDKVFYNRAVTYYNTNNYDLAIEEYCKAIELNNSECDYYYNRGLAYYNKEEYNLAELDFTKAIELNDNDPDYYLQLALAKIYSGEILDPDSEEIKKIMEKASKSSTDTSEIYFQKGELFFRKRSYDQALEEYNIAINLNQSDYRFYLSRALCYYKTRLFDKAEVEWKYTIENFPNDSLAYICLSELYVISNQVELAIKILNEFNKSKPDEDEILFFHYLQLFIQILTKKPETGLHEKFIKSLNSIQKHEYDLTELENFINKVPQLEIRNQLIEITKLLKSKQQTPLHVV